MHEPCARHNVNLHGMITAHAHGRIKLQKDAIDLQWMRELEMRLSKRQLQITVSLALLNHDLLLSVIEAAIAAA